MLVLLVAATRILAAKAGRSIGPAHRPYLCPLQALLFLLKCTLTDQVILEIYGVIITIDQHITADRLYPHLQGRS